MTATTPNLEPRTIEVPQKEYNLIKQCAKEVDMTVEELLTAFIERYAEDPTQTIEEVVNHVIARLRHRAS